MPTGQPGTRQQYVQIRLPADLHAQIKKLAESECRPITGTIRKMYETYTAAPDRRR